jgi:predicted anti-sigma-YlaC factor YlaD
MNRIEDSTVRDGRCGQLTGAALERHLFACADCRGRMRLLAAWDVLREEVPSVDGVAPSDERFVARVLEAVRRDGSRQRRRRLWLAAAAVLLFFFAAGASSHSRPAGPSSTEEAYASLATTSALEELLPE